eukprot:c19491_g1_i1 orf=130-3072(-)
MRGKSPVYTDEGPSTDVYFEFNFFDGVVVDCKEVNNAEWGPWQSRPKSTPKLWDASGLDESIDLRNLRIGRELQESNALHLEHMESRHDRKEKQTSPKREGKNHETINAATGVRLSDVGNSSVRGSLLVAGANEDPTNKKRVQFLNGEKKLSWNQQSSSLNSSEHRPLDSLPRNSFGSSAACYSRDGFHQQGPCGLSQRMPFNKFHSDDYAARNPLHAPCDKYGYGDYAARDPVSLSTGHLDWLWSEEPERQETLAAVHNEHGPFSAPSGTNGEGRSSDYIEKENRHDLPLCIGNGLSPGDSMLKVSSRHSWKAPGSDTGKSVSGALAAVTGADSARCSSMSLTDLVETSPKKCSRDVTHRERSTLASHLQLAGSSLANQFCTKETDVECIWPFSPAHSSLSTSSASKRDSTGLKSEPRGVSITEPHPHGNMHGLLHCTLRAGLPNYTFLLDDYDEVVTAKIWMEDIILGEDQGAWRYTFYSLKGDSKKKGKSGWKHWRRKEKLASELVGKMRVSSVLRSEPSLHGEVNVSVESEFVLSSARAQEPSVHALADFSSQTSSSSLETGSHGCSKASYAVINTSSSPSQSRASSSDGGLSDVSSPGAISAWYVSQSLIPSSIGSPDMIPEGRQKSRKWSLHSGISGMRMSKSKKRSQQSSNLIVPSSNMSTEEFFTEVTCSLHQPYAELAAMIINVPMELQDRLTGSTAKKVSDTNGTGELGSGECRNYEEATVPEIHGDGDHTKHKIHEQHRHAKITVILPSGNHGRPLSDMKGPSPLIKRWKEGGKCDCKGWDLGCGLLVLNNEQPAAVGSDSTFSKSREYQSHSKPLTLFKQDTDQEEAYISLAPQESGLIAVDFRAPLSPLQAFAMAVAILHGRGSGVPDVDTSHVMTAASNFEAHAQEKKTVNQNCQPAEQDADGSSLGFMTWRENESKRMDSYMQSSIPSNRDTLFVHDNLGGAHVKPQGSDVFSCASDLALSFERV